MTLSDLNPIASVVNWESVSFYRHLWKNCSNPKPSKTDKILRVVQGHSTWDAKDRQAVQTSPTLGCPDSDIELSELLELLDLGSHSLKHISFLLIAGRVPWTAQGRTSTFVAPFSCPPPTKTQEPHLQTEGMLPHEGSQFQPLEPSRG